MATAPKKGASKPAAKPAAEAAKGNGEAKTPGVQVVSAKLSEGTMKDKFGGKPSPVVSVEYNFGATLDESVELFGEQIVHSKFVDSAVIDLQSTLRRAITASLMTKNAKGEAVTPKPLPKDSQSLVAEWKPSAGHAERKSAAEKVTTLVGKLTAEERADLIARLKAGA